MGTFISNIKRIAKRVPGAAHYYRQRRAAKSLRSTTLYRDALGFKFNGHPAMQDGTFEPEETNLFDRMIGHVDVFVNIGANVGYYSVKALAAGKEVVAFEPDELNGKIFLRNVHSNAFEAAFHFFPIALGDKPGILPLYGSSTGASLIKGWAGQMISTLVPVNSFDNVANALVKDKSRLVFIDVEGAELPCLQGAMALLDEPDRSTFLVEIAITEHQPDGVTINPDLQKTFDLFFSKGFAAFTADSTLREVPPKEISDIAKTGVDTLEVHNFIFIARDRALASVGLV